MPSPGKKRPCLKSKLSWALLALLVLLSVTGTVVGVVLGRRSAAAMQQGAAAAAPGLGEPLQYSINIKMAPDSKGGPGPSCATLFGGPSPRTVSVGLGGNCWWLLMMRKALIWGCNGGLQEDLVESTPMERPQLTHPAAAAAWILLLRGPHRRCRSTPGCSSRRMQRCWTYQSQRYTYKRWHAAAAP